MSNFTQDQMVKIVPGSVWVARHLQAHRHSLARPLSGSCVERLLTVGCGPQGDQKSQACRHEGVKDLVSSYLCSLPPDEVRRAAENLLVRCRVCADMEGGHCEHVRDNIGIHI